MFPFFIGGKEETALNVEVGIDALHSARSYDLILIVTLEDFAALAAALARAGENS